MLHVVQFYTLARLNVYLLVWADCIGSCGVRALPVDIVVDQSVHYVCNFFPFFFGGGGVKIYGD